MSTQLSNRSPTPTDSQHSTQSEESQPEESQGLSHIDTQASTQPDTQDNQRSIGEEPTPAQQARRPLGRHDAFLGTLPDSSQRNAPVVTSQQQQPCR